MNDDIKAIRDALAAGPTPGPHKAHKSLVFFGNVAGGFDLRDCPAPEANAQFFAACHPDRIARLLDALELATKDAARYRWLRDDPPLSLAVRRHPGETEAGCYLDGYNLDSAIDSAMKATP